MVGHQEVVLDGQVEAVVARPADIERLALDGARGHVDELGKYPELDVVVHARIVDHRAGDQRQREVARVDGQTLALADVEARLSSAGLGGVLDVVVDERGGVEVLDGSRGRVRLGGVPADRLAREQTDERTVTFSRVRRVAGQRAVEVALHVRVGTVGEEGGEVGVHLLGVALEVELEADHDPPSRTVPVSRSPHVRRG